MVMMTEWRVDGWLIYPLDVPMFPPALMHSFMVSLLYRVQDEKFLLRGKAVQVEHIRLTLG